MDFWVMGGMVLDSSKYPVCMVQTSQINSNSYSLVFVCLWLGRVWKESSEKPGVNLPMWQARGNS